jgi:hypothetical protein
MKHGAPDALEVLGPHGWYFRLDPAGVVNIWPCGRRWSWVRMSRASRDPLLVRGNALELVRQWEGLVKERKLQQ